MGPDAADALAHSDRRARAAVSAILERPDDARAGEFNLIAFELRKLTSAECLYPLHTLELLAVVHALKTLSPGQAVVTVFECARPAEGRDVASRLKTRV